MTHLLWRKINVGTPRMAMVVVALVLTAGCAGEESAEQVRAAGPITPVTIDSAGIKLHQHSPGALARAPRLQLDSVPIAEFLDSFESDGFDLSSLTDFRFLSDGRVVAAQVSYGAVAVLNPQDGSRTSFGRRGAGPREFGSHVRIAGTAGDTVLATDFDNNRVALVHPDSGIVGTRPLVASAFVLGVTSDGGILGRVSFPSPVFDGADVEVKERPIGVVKWWANTAVRDTILVLPGPQELWERTQRAGQVAVSVWPLRFSPSPSVRWWGERILFAPAGNWVLERYDDRGTLREVIRLGDELEPATPAMVLSDIEARMARYSARGDSGVELELARDREERLPVPTHLPAFGRIGISPAQLLWVVDYHRTGQDGWAATAFDSDGRLVGRIEEARGNRPVAFGDGLMLFRSENEDGLATLTVRRLL